MRRPRGLPVGRLRLIVVVFVFVADLGIRRGRVVVVLGHRFIRGPAPHRPGDRR